MVNEPVYKYSKLIADKIRDGIAQGVSLKQIMETVQHYQECPSSATTFRKIYSKDIAEAKFDLSVKLGQYAMTRIAEGSDPILLHALKSKAGWIAEEKVTVRETDEEETDTSVIDDILTKLGKNKNNEADPA
jgi:hypothetical protein